MEVSTSDIDHSHLGIGYGDAFWIALFVQLAADGQTSAGGCRRNKLNDHFVADQRFSAPVLADEREQAVLDLIPLAGAGRQVTDDNLKPDLVRKLLQFPLPQSHPRAIAAAAISRDQQPRGVGIARPAERLPQRLMLFTANAAVS